MPEKSPRDVGVLELRDGDLACESAVGLVEDVLGGDFDAGAEVLAGEEEVEGGRRDDDFGGGVDFGVVEAVDNFFYGVDCAVPVVVFLLETFIFMFWGNAFGRFGSDGGVSEGVTTF